MRTNLFGRFLATAAVATTFLAVAPGKIIAQSGKWVATISQLGTAGGAADLTIEPRNDKQSRARLVLRNSKSSIPLSWDIVEGNCRDEGKPIAPQAVFTKIQTQMDGGGTVTANIPKLESGKRYYIRVFDPGTPVTDGNAYGCANLSEQP